MDFYSTDFNIDSNSIILRLFNILGIFYDSNKLYVSAYEICDAIDIALENNTSFISSFEPSYDLSKENSSIVRNFLEILDFLPRDEIESAYYKKF